MLILIYIFFLLLVNPLRTWKPTKPFHTKAFTNSHLALLDYISLMSPANSLRVDQKVSNHQWNYWQMKLQKHFKTVIMNRWAHWLEKTAARRSTVCWGMYLISAIMSPQAASCRQLYLKDFVTVYSSIQIILRKDLCWARSCKMIKEPYIVCVFCQCWDCSLTHVYHCQRSSTSECTFCLKKKNPPKSKCVCVSMCVSDTPVTSPCAHTAHWLVCQTL